MSRIRTIKPDFWTDEKVVSLSPLARLLFIGMWNFVDDYGRSEYSPTRLKMQILPADSAEISELLGEIRREKLITVYVVDNKEYFAVKGFGLHQKVDHRSPSKIPDNPNSPPNFPEPSRKLATEGKGMEGNGREWNGKKDSPASGTINGFVGTTIKVTDRDLEKWKKAYHAVPDMLAELTKADDYISTNPSDDGKWYFRVSSWLERVHKTALKKTADVYDPRVGAI